MRVSPIVNLHVAGKIIGTTAEHPFYVKARGWLACRELDIGDELLAADGEWLPVEGVAHSGEVTTVYNMRVADHHTYFVGGDEWGWSLWAHNARYLANKIKRVARNVSRTINFKKGQAPRVAEAIKRNNRAEARKILIDEVQGVGKVRADQILDELAQGDVRVVAGRTNNPSLRPVTPEEFGLLQDHPQWLGRFVRDPNDFPFGQYLKEKIGDAPSDMPDPHAHHVLFKGGNGPAQQALVAKGQAILRQPAVGIDPDFGLENLVWAPLRVAGQHDIHALRKVVNTINQVHVEGGDTADFALALQRLGSVAAQRR